MMFLRFIFGTLICAFRSCLDVLLRWPLSVVGKGAPLTAAGGLMQSNVLWSKPTFELKVDDLRLIGEPLTNGDFRY